MAYPSFEQVAEIAAGGAYGVVPVAREIFSDLTTPIRVLQILQGASDHCYLLESVDDSKQWGRYSYLGYDPTMELTCTNGEVHLAESGQPVEVPQGDPRPVLERIIADNRSPRVEGMPSFTGGLVGYFSYDYLKYAEPTLRLDARDEEGFKDIDLMLFDKVIAFDNARQKIVFVVNMRVDGKGGLTLAESYAKAEADLDRMAQLVIEGVPVAPPQGRLTSPIRALFDKEQYCEMVRAGKNHIKEGDIFQVVLSNRLDADFEGSLLNTYRTLRCTNPSPYMFYFCSDDIEMAGSSPETLVKLEDGVLHTFPLAGTRPRGATPDEDKRLEKELLADEKELAEHNMLVDLGRNDIGKVSEFGSVRLESYHEVLKYSHVMHIGSEVSGRLREGCTAVDAIDSILPAGTLSGAPKLRAAQIINDLEDCKRGVYGGAIGYIALTGNMDTCIAIRLAFKKNGRVFVRSGAGIVADSVPETEYQECINKAQAVVSALEGSKEAGSL